MHKLIVFDQRKSLEKKDKKIKRVLEKSHITRFGTQKETIITVFFIIPFQQDATDPTPGATDEETEPIRKGSQEPIRCALRAPITLRLAVPASQCGSLIGKGKQRRVGGDIRDVADVTRVGYHFL